jgi:hypothetical protein
MLGSGDVYRLEYFGDECQEGVNGLTCLFGIKTTDLVETVISDKKDSTSFSWIPRKFYRTTESNIYRTERNSYAKRVRSIHTPSG